MNEDTDDYDPFSAPLDPEEDQKALIAALQMLRGFGLFFAVTNSATERNRRMDSVVAQFPGKVFQHVAVNTETYNLLWHLREVLSDPKPDVLFVSGLENWISGAVNPRSVDFLLNLNATRDSFPLLLPAPMVIWVPQYVLRAIANAAPDFFSVRSGVYSFPTNPIEREETARIMSQIGTFESINRPESDRIARIQEIKGLLSEYENLPESERNVTSELHLSILLATQLLNEERYAEAEQLLVTSSILSRASSEYNHPSVSDARVILATVYSKQGKYKDAEHIYLHELINERSLSHPRPKKIAQILANYGETLRVSGRIVEAESILREVISGYGQHLDAVECFASLNNLALIYESQHKFQEAEKIYHDLHVIVQKIPARHPMYAQYANNLGSLFRNQGRYAESEPLLLQALEIRRELLPSDHVQIAISLTNLAGLYGLQGRYSMAEPLYLEALEIVNKGLSKGHPIRASIEHNYEQFKDVKALHDKGTKGIAVVNIVIGDGLGIRPPIWVKNQEANRGDGSLKPMEIKKRPKRK